jgi:hypothetical protein
MSEWPEPWRVTVLSFSSVNDKAELQLKDWQFARSQDSKLHGAVSL